VNATKIGIVVAQVKDQIWTSCGFEGNYELRWHEDDLDEIAAYSCMNLTRLLTSRSSFNPIEVFPFQSKLLLWMLLPGTLIQIPSSSPSSRIASRGNMLVSAAFIPCTRQEQEFEPTSIILYTRRLRCLRIAWSQR
jgi:hypothetical protein